MTHIWLTHADRNFHYNVLRVDLIFIQWTSCHGENKRRGYLNTPPKINSQRRRRRLYLQIQSDRTHHREHDLGTQRSRFCCLEKDSGKLLSCYTLPSRSLFNHTRTRMTNNPINPNLTRNFLTHSWESYLSVLTRVFTRAILTQTFCFPFRYELCWSSVPVSFYKEREKNKSLDLKMKSCI